MRRYRNQQYFIYYFIYKFCPEFRWQVHFGWVFFFWENDCRVIGVEGGWWDWAISTQTDGAEGFSLQHIEYPLAYLKCVCLWTTNEMRVGWGWTPVVLRRSTTPLRIVVVPGIPSVCLNWRCNGVKAVRRFAESRWRSPSAAYVWVCAYVWEPNTFPFGVGCCYNMTFI